MAGLRGLRRLRSGQRRALPPQLPFDRVAAMLPNLPEAVIGMLATASLGAIWSSCSPDFGVQGVLDRFGQIAPKVRTCDTSFIGLKTHGRCTLAEVVEIDEATYREHLETLTRHFLKDLHAPSEEAARQVAEEEVAYTADLCESFNAET